MWSLVDSLGSGGTTNECGYMLVCAVGSVARGDVEEVWGGPVGIVLEILNGSNRLGITLPL